MSKIVRVNTGWHLLNNAVSGIVLCSVEENIVNSINNCTKQKLPPSIREKVASLSNAQYYSG